MSSEHKRKLVHIGMVAFALLVGRIPPLWISLACGLAFAGNLFLLPKLTGHALERAEDRKRGFALGILLYPAVLLVLSVVFFKSQVFLVVAWGALAFGDGFAGLAGRRIGGHRIAWNPAKTWAGTGSFFLLGSLLTWLWVMLLPEAARLGIAPSRWAWIVAGALLAAAMIETVKGLVDDNLAVPVSAAMVAFFLAQSQTPGVWPDLPPQWPIGAGLVLLLILLSVLSGKIDRPGGLVGGILAAAMYLGCGLLGLGLLFTFFVLGSLASHWKYEEKAKGRLAQENRGKRSVRHAMANGGTAAVCGLLAWFFPSRGDLFLAMLAASLASAAADTLSSELGNLYGRRFINIVTLKADKRGLDGVISLEGSLFGALGSLAIALIFGAVRGFDAGFVWIAVAGIAGNLFDSFLGATLQRGGYMTNDTVNFANTGFAAVTIWVVWSLL